MEGGEGWAYLDFIGWNLQRREKWVALWDPGSELFIQINGRGFCDIF